MENTMLLEETLNSSHPGFEAAVFPREAAFSYEAMSPQLALVPFWSDYAPAEQDEVLLFHAFDDDDGDEDDDMGEDDNFDDMEDDFDDDFDDDDDDYDEDDDDYEDEDDDFDYEEDVDYDEFDE